MRILLKAHNGQYLSVVQQEKGQVRADQPGVGNWEVFDVVVPSQDGVLRSEDLIHLRAYDGRFVVAERGGGAAVLANREHPGPWETFTIFKLGSTGFIHSGARIALRSFNGNYLTAEAGGDRSVLANRNRISLWETFTLELWSTQLIHLRCSNGKHFLSAKDGGGGEMMADCTQQGAAETITLVNRSSRSGGVHDNDLVNMQVWSGNFIAADDSSGKLLAVSKRASARESFHIRRLDQHDCIIGGEIQSGDRVRLQAFNDSYVATERGGGGEVHASSRRSIPGTGEIFVMEAAEIAPMEFECAPTTIPPYPLYVGASAQPNKVANAKVRSLLTLLVNDADKPTPVDEESIVDRVREVLFGAGSSVRSWLERNSYGQFSISDVGVYGPFPLPLALAKYSPAAPPINATRLEAVASTRFRLVRLTGAGFLCHGDSIIIKADNNRYISRENSERGYLFADTDAEDCAQIFRIERLEGPGCLQHKNAFTLVTPSAQYVTAESGGGELLTCYRSLPNVWEIFTIERLHGPAAIASGEPVAILSSAGRYCCADPFARCYDTLNAAARAGVDVSALAIHHDDTMRSLAAQAVILDYPNTDDTMVCLQGSLSTRTVGAIDGVGCQGLLASIDATQLGDGAQGVQTIEAYKSILQHKLVHALFELPERCGYIAPIRGDVIADRAAPSLFETFSIERLHGVGMIRHGEEVIVRAHTGAIIERTARGFVNIVDSAPSENSIFTLEAVAQLSPTIITGSQIALKTRNGYYLTAEDDYTVVANRALRAPGTWETFTVFSRGSNGAIQSNNRINLKTAHGHYVIAEPGGRTSRKEHLQQGYVFVDGAGLGVGGGFDIMGDQYSKVMMCAYDRIKQGWITPKVLIPENRACYTLRPSIDHAQAYVLWDPQYPNESYTVEMRIIVPEYDELLTAGLVISWVCEDLGYWSQWLENSDRGQRYNPAVISPAASTLPANMMQVHPTLLPLETFKRKHPNAAFRSGEFTLRRGDGVPSRFRLSFRECPDQSLVFCINP